MKKVSKILSIVLMAIMVMSTATTVFAANTNSSGVSPTNFTGKNTNVSGITNIGNQLITIISTVGSIASVIVLVILGLKYMIGSAEEKAEYKKTLLPYIIGAALVFAASAIATVIFSFTSNLSGS